MLPFRVDTMGALRAWAAILLAALAVAIGSRTPVARSVATSREPCAAEAPNITRVELPPGSRAFLAASPVASLPATAEEGGRTHVPPVRSLRLCPTPRLLVPAARVAAVVRDRLGFAQSLDAARLGYFSFGSTAPPPFRA